MPAHQDETKPSSFSKQVAQFQNRAHSLEEKLQPLADLNTDIAHIYYELQFALKELRVAQEELAAQNEAQEKAEREQFFKVSFQKSPVGMIQTAANMQLIRVNEKFCAMLGYTAEELIGRSFLDMTDTDDHKLCSEMHQQLFRGERENGVHEQCFLRKDGAIMWARVTTSHIPPFRDHTAYNIAVIERPFENSLCERRSMSKAC